jgi:hypothetical protein
MRYPFVQLKDLLIELSIRCRAKSERVAFRHVA